MPYLITGLCYEECGDCSKIKRQFHIEKHGLKYVAYVFKGLGWYPINKGRYRYKKLLKDIEQYKKDDGFYHGWECEIINCFE